MIGQPERLAGTADDRIRQFSVVDRPEPGGVAAQLKSGKLSARMVLAAFLGIHDERVSAAVISVLTAAFVVFLTLPLREWLRLNIDSRLYQRKGDADYLLEQRKALSALIGAHHGRLIDAADRFCHRAVRIEKHAGDDWLDPQRAPTGGYFFDSTICRFLVVAGAAESLERRGLVIDQRVGRPEDQKLIWFARAFRWCLTASELFDGTEYDPERATEHFFTDTFRDLCRGFDGGELDPGFGVMRGRIRTEASMSLSGGSLPTSNRASDVGIGHGLPADPDGATQ